MAEAGVTTRTGPDDVASQVRVVLIDDHPIYRQGLAGALAASHDLAVIGTFESVEDYEAVAPAAHVVLLDYDLPGCAGPAAVIRAAAGGSIVLMLSGELRRDSVLDCLDAGARGYVDKRADVGDIIAAIRTVTGGNEPAPYVSATLASFLLDASSARDTGALELTAREREVLALLASGERDQDIAEELGIALGTVNAHLEHIRTKSGQHRRAQLTRFAAEQGLISANGTELSI